MGTTVTTSAARERPRLLHALPGRVRVYLPSWSGEHHRRVEERICAGRGVRRARANALTRNVLVFFDPAVTSMGEILAGLCALPRPASDAPDLPCVALAPALPGAIPGVGRPPRARMGEGAIGRFPVLGAVISGAAGAIRPRRSAPAAHPAGPGLEDPGAARPAPWYATPAGRLVAGSGLLVALAGAASAVAPAAGAWVYGAATLLAVRPLAHTAWEALRAGQPFTIQALVTVAAVGALGIGAAAEGALVVFLFNLGELLEGRAAGSARRAVAALAAATPARALLVVGDGTRDVPAASLVVGDRVRVLPRARVPVDGVVVAGEAGGDEASLTGEPAPVHRGPGARVYAGSIPVDGVLTIEARAEAADTMLARIIHRVAEAEGEQGRTARFIDRFARAYTPVILGGGLVTAVLPPLLWGGAWATWAYRALALLLLGCPCALVIATPAAVSSALATGARRGLLIKGGQVLETLAKVRVVAFDKTGTLTTGAPRVTDVVALGDSAPDEAAVLAAAAAVEATSTHPLARAIVAAARARELPLALALDGAARPGRAVTATVGRRRLTVGSPRHAREVGVPPGALDAAVARLEGAGKTAVILHEGTRALGVLGLRDEPRPDASAGVAALRALGVESVMVSGDNPRAAGAVADEMGIVALAGLLPEDKVAVVRRLAGRGVVALVGDGINDAPALATADVGIAMGDGADIALDTADVALPRGSVAAVADLLRLARATMRIVRQNVAVALGLKGVVLVATLLGGTTLWLAVLADTGATVLVTLNALRLLRGGAHG